jgi:hypothetical protein
MAKSLRAAACALAPVKAWDAFLTYARSRPGVAFLRKDAIARHVLQSPITVRESETI